MTSGESGSSRPATTRATATATAARARPGSRAAGDGAAGRRVRRRRGRRRRRRGGEHRSIVTARRRRRNGPGDDGDISCVMAPDGPRRRSADLELFVAVLDTGSLSQAAARHGISQPAASARLRGLERRLGVQLLERSSAGSTPTAAGLSVADAGRRRARRRWPGSSTASAALHAVGEQLRVVASYTIAEHLLPGWLSTFHRGHPTSAPSCGSPTRRSSRTRCAPAVPTSASSRARSSSPTCTPWRSPPTSSSSSSRPTTRGPRRRRPLPMRDAGGDPARRARDRLRAPARRSTSLLGQHGMRGGRLRRWSSGRRSP